MGKVKTTVLNFFRKRLRWRPFEHVLYQLSRLGMDTWVAKLAPGNELYPTGSIRTVSRKGIRYQLDISDYQHWILYFGVTKDDPIGLFDLVMKGDYIIDIGTNIGQTAMTFAKLGGADSMILGFEPDPVNFSIAMNNLALNDLQNIEIMNIGLGATRTELKLKINSATNRGGNRIDREDRTDSIRIPIETLDHIIGERKTKKIDLIKIDVEGFEMEVLKGAARTLKEFHPQLFIEVDDNNLKEQRSSARVLISYVESSGYRVRSSEGRTIDPVEDLSGCHFDLIAFPIK